MNLDLTGKIAFISGSTAGIGLATATGLCKLNATVIINGRSNDRVEKATKSILAQCPNAKLKGVVADLGTATGAEQLFQKLPEIDILVNNMGIYEPKEFYEITDEEWMHYFQVNVLSGVRLSRFYLPKMMTKNWGRIVFVASESAVNVPPEMIHYGVSKTCQVAVARGLAEMTRSSNVTVNSVMPGPTRTEGVLEYLGKMAEQKGMNPKEVEKEFMRDHRPTSIIQRLLSEEEVANSIVYLCSPASSGTNGASMRVEGGLLRNFL